MGLLQMSLYGSVMIAVVALIRTALVNRLPKRTFVILWCVVLARLLIPFEIPSAFSVYSLFEGDVTEFVESRMAAGAADEAENSPAGKGGQSKAVRERQAGGTADNSAIAEIPLSEERYGDNGVQGAALPYTGGNVWQADTAEAGKAVPDSGKGTRAPGFVKDHAGLMIYGIGALLCIGYFVTGYVRCRFEFGMSLPVSDDYVLQWLEERRRDGHGNGIWPRLGWRRPNWFRPAVTVRVSDRIDTPLTYRVIRPVILLPKKTAWERREQMNYVLWHEYTHICHGDSVWKVFAAAALCIHWCNPLVWVMYYLLNRDIELACDESVIYRCGVADKSAYANMLIDMAAKRSGLVPLSSNFSQNAIEERVRVIMKMKKISVGAVLFAVGMVAGVTTAFATSAGSMEERVLTERETDEIPADRTLTVGEYVDARLAAADMISNMMNDYDAETLADEERMQEEIGSGLRALEEALSTETVRVNVEEWFYQPLEAEEQALHAAVQEEIQGELAEVLKPYLPFGLSYEYDTQADDFKMYYRGREVRGIIDERQSIFISAHTGISTYAQDATEVFAVYDEAGNLTGLRTATGEEQEAWDLRRKKSTYGPHETVEEFREYPPGTNEDYDLLLSLKREGYDKMTLADFDRALLNWANAHSDSYDRIECDTIWDDSRVTLSEEDRNFITRTVHLSGIENGMMVRSLYRGKTEEEAEDPSLSDDMAKSLDGGDEGTAWCRLFYDFSYQIRDKRKVTVGERNRAVGGMMDAVEDFWAQTDIEELLRMEKSDIMQKLNDLATKHSTGGITITVAEDRTGFECMDERPFMR